jgi:hypothetical protein
MRGIPSGGADAWLEANTYDAETSPVNAVDLSESGFTVNSGVDANISGQTYIYLAIRRPNKPPESGSEVYNAQLGLSSVTQGQMVFDAGIPLDMTLRSLRGGGTAGFMHSRLQGAALRPQLTNAESAFGYGVGFSFDSNTGIINRDTGTNVYTNQILHGFRRAPGFFDVVCYTGTGVARTVAHNLGVAPELMIVKSRSYADEWPVYSSALGMATHLTLNTTNAKAALSNYWNNTTPTEGVFSLSNRGEINTSGQTYVAYLFASLPGISKVGSYTGNGSTQTINCGFSTGARFVLIKRTDSTGDWFVWDTARGIVAADDPHLSLNTTAAEVTTDDSIDPDNSGFIVNQNTTTNINVSTATYIFLAIA